MVMVMIIIMTYSIVIVNYNVRGSVAARYPCVTHGAALRPSI